MLSNLSGSIAIVTFVSLAAAASHVFAQDSGEFEEPEILYAGWRISGTSDDVKYRLWMPDGSPLDIRDARAIEESLNQFEFPVPAGEATPNFLLLVFRVDWRSPKYPIKTQLTLPNNKRAVFDVAINKSDESWVVVCIPCGRHAWPESGSLQVRYPIEHPVEIWKTDEAPREDTGISEGISCATRQDTRGDYLETCFRPGLGDWEEHNYLVSVFLDGDDPPVAIRPPRLTGTSRKYEYELTDYFDPGDVKKISVMKQTCRGFDPGDIKIRKDLFSDQ